MAIRPDGESGSMPRTEAGKRQHEASWARDRDSVITEDEYALACGEHEPTDDCGACRAIESIEYEAEHQGYLRANDCDHSECIEREEQARLSERNRIIEVIANIPVTIQFREPVTKIDLWQYHADVIKAIMKAQR